MASEFLKYDDIHDLCMTVAEAIPQLTPDVERIVVVSRNALIPATLIANATPIKDLLYVPFELDEKSNKFKASVTFPKKLINDSKTIVFQDFFNQDLYSSLISQYPKAWHYALYADSKDIKGSSESDAGVCIDGKAFIFRQCFSESDTVKFAYEESLKPLSDETEQSEETNQEQLDYLEEHKDTVDSRICKLTNDAVTDMLEKDKEMEEQGEVQLSQQQRKAVSYILNSKKNVLLTGKAGSGKSTIIKTLLKLRPKWAICSTTGKAAVLVGGVTIDTLFCYDRSLNITRDDNVLARNMEGIGDTIIVDEASMVGMKMFNHITRIANLFDKRLVLVGDWGQAKPVKDDWFFPLETKDFDFIKLTECFRQKNGEFLDCLDKIRVGVQDDEVNSLFEKRICPMPPTDDSCVLLYPFNKQADAYNNMRIEKILAEEKKQGKSGTGLFLRSKIRDVSPNCNKKILERALENSVYAHELKLAIGCKVLITRNSQDKSYVNGDTGVLVDAACSEKGDVIGLHVFVDRLFSVVEIPICETTIKDEKGEMLYKIVGFPIKAGYALTIHKSQGMTIPKIWVDIKSISDYVTHGIVYVALSRVRRVDDLYVNYWCNGLAYAERPVQPYL